ncbi:MAG TPA: hypothetical protein VLT33_40265 [Labilithrix sp.]|nr:hypothetical protein [Labilithrix sp.]
MNRALPFVLLVPAIAMAACGAGVGPGGGDAGADSSTATGGAACTADPDCNNDPMLSSLLGKCTTGVCVCNPRVAVTNGKCGEADGSTPSNCEEKGGKCFGLGGGTPPPSSYRAANPGEATCGSYPGTHGGTDTGCFFPK